jgi:MFS transporter, SP family, solute carrier family 2 (facilitated glucose transporter), member 3
MVGSILFQFCRSTSSIELLIIGRFLVGLASGITTTCLPIYLSEIAPLQLRGTLGVFCSMGMTAGVVVGQVCSLQETFGTPEMWHISLSFQFFIVLISVIPYAMFPESPKYIMSEFNDRTRAIRELMKLCENREMAENELNDIQPHADAKHEGGQSLKSVLANPQLLLPLILVMAMTGGQQMSGINAVSKVK